MLNESVKASSHSSADGANQHKQFDRELREMVKSLTGRVTDFHMLGSVHREVDEDEQGLRIITLAGTNTGASLRGELDHEKPGPLGGPGPNDLDGLKTYLNSNFQAINNSLMLGGSYSANDPGVKVEIEDFFERGHTINKHEKQKWKGKKKEKEKEKEKESHPTSDHHSHEHDDEQHDDH